MAHQSRPGLKKAVLFDAAGTLIDVRWSLPLMARRNAESLGLTIPESAFGAIEQLYFQKLPEYRDANRSRDHNRCEGFWDDFTAEWLTANGLPIEWVEPLRREARRLGFGDREPYFQVYEDVFPALELLVKSGIRLAIISNWDFTLHQILDHLGLSSYFQFVYVSLEHGYEKPHSHPFQVTLEALGLSAREVVHVGDDPIDDGKGAANAGIIPILISRTNKIPGRIQSLAQLQGVLVSIS